MDRTKILLNVHQTDEHDTLEEFRVLPALLRGVVVISEEVPLREKIPYHKYIVWCEYDELKRSAVAVSSDYQAHFDRIHGADSKLPRLIGQMRKRSAKALGKSIINYQREREARHTLGGPQNIMHQGVG